MTKIYLRNDAAAATPAATKTNYMQELDTWIDNQVIEPLFEAWDFQSRVADDESAKEAAQEVEATRGVVHKAIREKVLESYRNGQGAAPAKKRFFKRQGR